MCCKELLSTFYAPTSIDLGHIVLPCLFVCLSSKDFKTGHKFGMVSNRAFIFLMTCVFLVVRPFLWCQGQGHLS